MKKAFVVALLALSASGFSQAVGDKYYIETTTPGAHLSDYTANGMSVSTARVTAATFPELTASRTQSAFCTLAALNKTPRFTPSALPAGRHQYNVDICWPNNAAINATGVTYRVKRGNGQIVTGTFSQLNAQNNTWFNIGSFDLDPSAGSYVEFDTSTANGGTADGAKRFYVDAMRFNLTAVSVPVTISGFSVE
jgi:hypothetical protein